MTCSKIKKYLKSKCHGNGIIANIYNKFYLPAVLKRRCKVTVIDNGKNNRVEIPLGTNCPNLRIRFLGSNNTVILGTGCNLYHSNYIHIQDDNNTILIGNNVKFDQNALLVCTEGSKITIGDDCLFANGATIRTGDQHFIFNENGTRLNPSKDVMLANHVWLGDHAVIMKGVTVGQGSVIGANSMVLGDIPENAVAVGTPARVVKTGIHWSE